MEDAPEVQGSEAEAPPVAPEHHPRLWRIRVMRRRLAKRSNASGEGAQPPPVAAIGWADESSEREGWERQRPERPLSLRNALQGNY